MPEIDELNNVECENEDHYQVSNWYIWIEVTIMRAETNRKM